MSQFLEISYSELFSCLVPIPQAAAGERGRENEQEILRHLVSVQRQGRRVPLAGTENPQE
jgi:hypothetical protein